MATKAKKNKGEKNGKKKKPQELEDNEALQEIDKEFYDIQITDLNQKLARLRSRCSELELENEDTKKNLQKLDEDRADIIAYQKRTLQAKSDEVTDLQEKLAVLQQTREAEKNSFLEKIKVMEHDFKSMHEQLNSEIKLLNGKLNSLEEFRREREELMNKFLKQEQEMEEQERRHEITLYEVERKFIVGKDELKKDMENKLLQLSLDFQNTTDKRIATTTHRVIRENVALNNEINVILESWKRLVDENKDLKGKEKELKIDAKIQRDDNKILLRKNAVQNKIIEKITSTHSRMEDAYKEMRQIQRHGDSLQWRFESALANLKISQSECQKLRQVLHAIQVEECLHEAQIYELKQECSKLYGIIESAAQKINEAFKSSTDPPDTISNEMSDTQSSHIECVLLSLLELFYRTGYAKIKPPGRRESVHTLRVDDLISSVYTIGDLGMMGKEEDKHEDETGQGH